MYAMYACSCTVWHTIAFFLYGKDWYFVGGWNWVDTVAVCGRAKERNHVFFAESLRVSKKRRFQSFNMLFFNVLGKFEDLLNP